MSMKAYRNVTLSEEQFSILEQCIGECESYIKNPEFYEVEVKSGWFSKKTTTHYRLENLPTLLSCWVVQSTSKDSFKVKPSEVGEKVFSLFLMFSTGSEVLVDDELHSVLWDIISRGDKP